MTASFLAGIDWSAPWLSPYAGDGRSIASSPDWRSALNHAAQQRQLCNFAGIPVQFVQQASLPAGEPYEAYIGRTGCVPTRDNLHDFFNALVWLGFPQTKARLNQLQFKQLQKLALESGPGAYRVGNSRGALRDAATIFDENGMLFIARDRELVNALIDRQWSTALLECKEQFGRSYDVIIFGHALLEKLVRPYAAITGHCLPLIDPSFTLPLARVAAHAELDQITASLLSPTTSTAAFFPVPVLGFPGWHPTQDAAFY
ncbi:MAG: DUF3025 domain-containing protein, partial [Lacisediminimonas sp.]|nr:DUF3025 domain-containing protein [Lacisediminimonas sp.]